MLRLLRRDGTDVSIDPRGQLLRFERIHPTRRAEIEKRAMQRVRELTEVKTEKDVDPCSDE